MSARELTLIFYELDPSGLGHYVNMLTSIPLKEFSINIDERPLFWIKAFELYRGVQLANIIVPSLRPADFAQDPESDHLPLMIQCMGPDIQLINIYAALTNPARASEWPTLLNAETYLREMYINNQISKIKSRKDKKPIADATEIKGGGNSTSILIKALISEYVSQSGHVVIGDFAICSLNNTNIEHPRLQLISSNTFKKEEQAVINIAARIGFTIQCIKNNSKVLTDRRLQRMTMYIIRPGLRREPFLDIYNAGEYELISFVRSSRSCRFKYSRADMPIGTPFVLLRFLLVDAWTIQLLYHMKVNSEQYTYQLLHDLLIVFQQVAEIYLNLRKSGNFKDIFPLKVESYIGKYVDPILYHKRQKFKSTTSQSQLVHKKQPSYYLPYYPARDTQSYPTDKKTYAIANIYADLPTYLYY